MKTMASVKEKYSLIIREIDFGVTLWRGEWYLAPLFSRYCPKVRYLSVKAHAL